MQKRAIYACPWGFFELVYENDVVLRFKKVHEKPEDMGETSAFSEIVFTQLSEYFAGKRKEFTFSYVGKGTEFQQKVWKALCDIPYGETRSYKEIAIAIGNEKACRAVGMANNKNPIGIIVPCHRVIGSSGKLVGYASGVEMKDFLLRMESENR